MEIETAMENRSASVPMTRVIKTWWPLAASWLMMSMEGPLISAVIARLADPVISLAAYGGIILPISLVIESPIIMLLSASTVLSKDYPAYTRLRKAMLILGGAFTFLHFLIAFTPLYDVVVNNILGAPPELVGPARTGLMIMLPWTLSIGYRRFNQGVMIRFGRSEVVMQCTIIRVAAILTVLSVGYFSGDMPGVIVAPLAAVCGVVAEGLFSGLRLRGIVRDNVKRAPLSPLFTWREFAVFYIPLVFTSLLQFIGNPVGSAALSRMPQAIDSLAVWGVVLNLLFLMRSIAMAYNEVVVALISEPGAYKTLRNFAHILAGFLCLVVLLLTFTPLSGFWFERVTGLTGELSTLARSSLIFFLIIPPISAYQSWFQGSILHSRKTRSITESVVLYLVMLVAVLAAGVIWGKTIGLYVGAAAFCLANLAQTFWLYLRSRGILSEIRRRDL
jgi:uncharacterized membrane protein YhdT